MNQSAVSHRHIVRPGSTRSIVIQSLRVKPSVEILYPVILRAFSLTVCLFRPSLSLLRAWWPSSLLCVQACSGPRLHLVCSFSLRHEDSSRVIPVSHLARASVSRASVRRSSHPSFPHGPHSCSASLHRYEAPSNFPRNFPLVAGSRSSEFGRHVARDEDLGLRELSGLILVRRNMWAPGRLPRRAKVPGAHG